MTKLPRSIEKKLLEYVTYLDMNIAREKSALAMVLPKGGITNQGQADDYRPMTEPIVRTITSYSFAKSELYRLFPELPKEEVVKK